MCGLRLEAIAAELSLQKPSAEMAELYKRQRQMQRLGVLSLSVAGTLGIALLMAKVFYYKLIILGPELLFGSAIGALILFMLASVFFFNYPKLFMKPKPYNELPGERDAAIPTNKLLADPPFGPASVTEHSTELLHRNK